MTKRCVEAFKKIYNKTSTVICFAPGRVNLIGEHIDYSGGDVLPCAINMGIFGAATKRNDNKIRLYSLNFESCGITEVSLDDIKRTATWADYPLGVINTLLRFGYNINCGADIIYLGNLPGGSGLSSSAAIEVLTVLIFNELFSLSIPKNLMALIGQYAENRFVGMHCGIMDQFAVAMGKKDNAIMLNSQTLDYKYINIPSEKADIIIVNSMVKHELANSAYNDRRNDCEEAFAVLNEKIGVQSLCDITPEQFEQYKGNLSGKISLRARHAIYENDRVKKASVALIKGDIELFGKLMNESHKSLKEDYDVSCLELDFLTQNAQRFDGVYGSRMTGAGFGGCTVNLVEKNKTEEFVRFIEQKYFDAFGIRAQIYVSRPTDGASLIPR